MINTFSFYLGETVPLKHLNTQCQWHDAISHCQGDIQRQFSS